MKTADKSHSVTPWNLMLVLKLHIQFETEWNVKMYLLIYFVWSVYQQTPLFLMALLDYCIVVSLK